MAVPVQDEHEAKKYMRGTRWARRGPCDDDKLAAHDRMSFFSRGVDAKGWLTGKEMGRVFFPAQGRRCFVIAEDMWQLLEWVLLAEVNNPVVYNFSSVLVLAICICVGYVAQGGTM
jgi:hypothetical protein